MWRTFFKKYRDNKNNEELLQSGYRYAYALTHHQQSAEDLIAQSWIYLGQTIRILDRKQLFRHIKKLFNEKSSRGEILTFQAKESFQPNLFHLIDQMERPIHGDLEYLLAHLSPHEREILYLQNNECLGPDEIAEIVGIHKTSIQKNLVQAKQRLHNIQSEHRRNY
jgi:RNA polymerase sigma-70 factor (ECF subfamily)